MPAFRAAAGLFLPLAVFFLGISVLFAVLFPSSVIASVDKSADAKCNPFIKECGCGQVLNSEKKCVGAGSAANMHNCACKSDIKPAGGFCQAENDCKGTWFVDQDGKRQTIDPNAENSDRDFQRKYNSLPTLADMPKPATTPSQSPQGPTSEDLFGEPSGQPGQPSENTAPDPADSRPPLFQAAETSAQMPEELKFEDPQFKSFDPQDAAHLEGAPPGAVQGDGNTLGQQPFGEDTFSQTYDPEGLGSCTGLWDCTVQGLQQGFQGLMSGAQPQQIEVGENGKIDLADFYNTAREKFANSDLIGRADDLKLPESVKREIFPNGGTADEWARFATQLCLQESSCRVGSMNSDGTVRKFSSTPSGEQSYGPLQFNKGEYGLETWADVNDPARTIDALVNVAEANNLQAYFGSIYRPNEILQHSAYFQNSVAPQVAQFSAPTWGGSIEETPYVVATADLYGTSLPYPEVRVASLGDSVPSAGSATRGVTVEGSSGSSGPPPLPQRNLLRVPITPATPVSEIPEVRVVSDVPSVRVTGGAPTEVLSPVGPSVITTQSEVPSARVITDVPSIPVTDVTPSWWSETLDTARNWASDAWASLTRTPLTDIGPTVELFDVKPQPLENPAIETLPPASSPDVAVITDTAPPLQSPRDAGFTQVVARTAGDTWEDLQQRWEDFAGSPTAPTGGAITQELQGAPATVPPLPAPNPARDPFGYAASQYPKGDSLVDFLEAGDLDSSRAGRADLAETHGVENYNYSAEKNLELLDKLRAQASGGTASVPLPAPNPARDPFGYAASQYPRGDSIVDFLEAGDLDSDPASRAQLAKQHGIENYDYSAQKNLELLAALRTPPLPVRNPTSAPSSAQSGATAPPTPSTAGLTRGFGSTPAAPANAQPPIPERKPVSTPQPGTTGVTDPALSPASPSQGETQSSPSELGPTNPPPTPLPKPKMTVVPAPPTSPSTPVQQAAPTAPSREVRRPQLWRF